MIVTQIPPEQARPWFIHKHYAKRCPCIEYAFGLYQENELLGVVSYGSPATPAIVQHLLKGKHEFKIIELNRLVINENSPENSASILVGRSLSLLPKPIVVVSYADTSQGHVGYIYQATNFLYTGCVTAHDAEYIVNGKKTHARTLTAKGITKPKQWARENNIKIIQPKGKHRYVYVSAKKKVKEKIVSILAYKILPYPKGETSKYDSGSKITTQIPMFLDA